MKLKKDTKLPLSSWHYYLQTVKKQEPDKNYGELMTLLAPKWKIMSETDKQPYKDMHEKDKQRYISNKHKVKPKRSRSAYIFMSKVKHKEIVDSSPQASFAEVGKKLGELWRSMSKDEKEPFENMAEEDRIRYQNDMENFKRDL